MLKLRDFLVFGGWEGKEGFWIKLRESKFLEKVWSKLLEKVWGVNVFGESWRSQSV